ncbi:MAG: PEP-CTERM/exosortase system-associated acyltransferase [Nitrosomonadaceae bacterium]|nr:PEP-CTERM/exosortase system-associated acyltransferase [Nitrosomonadaceae bacterium]
MNDLYQNFQKFFEIVVADTTEMLEQAYKIRYQVFCVEHNFLDASLYPDKLEKDDYDNHSSHVLLRYRPTGDFIGTVRLILPDVSKPEKLLPVELYSQTDPALCDIKSLPRQQTAEISRFLVMSQFDRRKDERRKEGRRKESAEIDSDKRTPQDRRSSDRRSGLSIGLVLMSGVMRMSVKYNIRHWLSVAEPALNKLMGFYGLNFNPIGPPVNYHGMRRPYYVKVEDALEKMYKEHHDAWEVVTDCGTYSFIHIKM